MAYFSFARAILEDKPIKVFNHGDMYRDFTYIDDVIQAVERVLCNPPKKNEQGVRYKIYNVGNSKPEKLIDFIAVLEDKIGKNAIQELCPMQNGDVYRTFADVRELERDFEFSPKTSIQDGINRFMKWYKGVYI
jgi:UDP-glucuronate 4-epimerase